MKINSKYKKCPICDKSVKQYVKNCSNCGYKFNNKLIYDNWSKKNE